VYVVAGLGGGTGGGMFLDVAYLLRTRLKRLGYHDPEVVGVLLLPPDGPPGQVAALAQANTYAALTELHHFSRAESVFAAAYDDRGAAVRDSDPPFSAVYLLPGLPHPPGGSGFQQFPAGRSGVLSRNGTPIPGRGSGVVPPAPDRDPTAAAADLIRLALLTPVGPAADAARPPAPADGPVAFRTAGVCRFGWPRGEVVGRAARVIAPVLLNHWTSPDPGHVHQVIPKWAADQWDRLGLDPEKLTARLSALAGDSTRGPVEYAVNAITEPLVPKGWRGKPPDRVAVSVAVNELINLLGRPQVMVNRAPAKIEEALAALADQARTDTAADLSALFHALVETPSFRVAGTQEAARQMVGMFDRAGEWCRQAAKDAQNEAAAALDKLHAWGHPSAAGKKLTPSDLADALRAFPEAQFRYLLCLAAARLYRHVRDVLAVLHAELTTFRQRLEGYQPQMAQAAEVPAGPPAPGDLLPPGTTTPEEAAQLFLKALTDDDLTALDAQVQDGLERKFGGLYQACLNTAEGPGGLLAVLREEARAYLDERLGEVDLAGMLGRRFGGPRGLADGLAQGFEQAIPPLVPGGPWASTEVTAFGCPAGAGGDPLRRAAAGVLAAAHPVDTRDEVVLYRELPAVPLAALGQLGPAWSTAYQAAAEQTQATPHTRTDVTHWIDVDTP
jgi:hypothetical protein